MESQESEGLIQLDLTLYGLPSRSYLFSSGESWQGPPTLSGAPSVLSKPYSSYMDYTGVLQGPL